MSFIQNIPETTSVEVAVRIRPLNERESQSKNIASANKKIISIINPDDKKKKSFTYDFTYDTDSTQEQVYNDIGEKVIDNSFKGYNSCIFAYGQTGCFAKDTPIMLIDGTYKAVQDIDENDIIMGDDSTPRTVLKLFRGQQNMYKIKSKLNGYDEYTVNEDHIMVFKVNPCINIKWINKRYHWVVEWYDIKMDSIRKRLFIPIALDTNNINNAKIHAEEFAKELDKDMSIVEMPLKQYLSLPNSKKKYYLCYTTGIDFPKYISNSNTNGYTNNDNTNITTSNNTHGNTNGNTTNTNTTNSNTNGNTNPDLDPYLLGVLICNSTNNNRIPHQYKTNSRDIRLKVLAGIIDVNGQYDKLCNSYQIIEKNKTLAYDIIYLARSLGYYAYVNTGEDNILYKKEVDVNIYKCYITGSNLEELPILSSDKKSIASTASHFNTFLPIVESLGEGEYFGFMLDKNHRFIGAGFNVLRNSGKSHTMMGDISSEKNKGIIPRLCQALFDKQKSHNSIPHENTNISYKVEMSYLEIYSEEVKDLMKKNNPPGGLTVRQHPEYGPYVEGLSQLVVEDFKSIKRLIDQGNRERVTASTLMNSRSSRSHAILTIYFTQIIQDSNLPDREIVSKINLVDLAGSERTEASGVTGINFKEAININKSLSTLGMVISKLAEISNMNKSNAITSNLNSTPSKESASYNTNSGTNSGTNTIINIKDKLAAKKSLKSSITSTSTSSGKQDSKSLKIAEHIPFRDSTLTWILKESLGGNSKTYMVAAISPSEMNYQESLQTLRYACNAKKIINTVKVNEDPNDKIIRILKSEIDVLREKLKNTTGTVSLSEIKQLKDELQQREALMKEKEKSWEQKLEESKRLEKIVQDQMRNEMTLKQAEFRKKLEHMNNEMEILRQEKNQMESSLSEKELAQQKIIEDELSKAQKEYERKQDNFEKTKIVETAVSLQQYYDNKLKELQQIYEEKLQQRDKKDNKETLEEIERLKNYSLTLKDDLNKSQRDMQVQMRQFTNDRAILSKQIQQLQSKIHTLEHDMNNMNSQSYSNEDIEKKTKEYNFIKQKRDEEEHKYNLLQTEYKALDNRIEHDKRLLDELNSKHQLILQEVESNNKILSDIKLEYSQLREKFEIDKDEYNSLLLKKEKLHTEIYNLKASLDIHINEAKLKLKNPTIDDLLKIKDGFKSIFDNIKNNNISNADG